MHDTILAIFLLLTVTANAQAKFNTIRANGHFGREIAVSFMQTTNNKESKEEKETLKADYTSESDSITATTPSAPSDRKRNVNKYGAKPSTHTTRNTLYNRCESNRYESDSTANLPELTLPNLLAEIRRNGIRHPKIVLAQAILETGWFRSSVCRNKHNLFGLTNPAPKPTTSSTTGPRASAPTTPKYNTAGLESTGIPKPMQTISVGSATSAMPKTPATFAPL